METSNPDIHMVGPPSEIGNNVTLGPLYGYVEIAA